MPIEDTTQDAATITLLSLFPGIKKESDAKLTGWDVAVVGLCAAMLLAFWLPWFSFLGLVTVSGFDLPRVIHGIASVAAAFGGHTSRWADVYYCVWLLPVDLIVAVVQVFRRRSVIVPALIAGVATLGIFGYVVARAGISSLDYVGDGGWMASLCGAGLLLTISVRQRLTRTTALRARSAWLPLGAVGALVAVSLVTAQIVGANATGQVASAIRSAVARGEQQTSSVSGSQPSDSPSSVVGSSEAVTLNAETALLTSAQVPSDWTEPQATGTSGTNQWTSTGFPYYGCGQEAASLAASASSVAAVSFQSPNGVPWVKENLFFFPHQSGESPAAQAFMSKFRGSGGCTLTLPSPWRAEEPFQNPADIPASIGGLDTASFMTVESNRAGSTTVFYLMAIRQGDDIILLQYEMPRQGDITVLDQIAELATTDLPSP